MVVDVSAASVLAVAIEARHQKAVGCQEEFRQLNIGLPLGWAVREKVREVQGIAENLDDALYDLAVRIEDDLDEEFFSRRVWVLDIDGEPADGPE